MKSTRHLHSLFRRCVECPPVTPTCPSCATDETCLLQAESCDACPSAICVKATTLPGQAEQRRASSTPAIAGGVVGGVVAIVIVTFLIWWYCIRKRRQQWDEQGWTETDQSIKGVEKRDQTGMSRGARESTRSSIASTARTRASNIIQIAYIPGVTNRSPTESPGLLAPPVPANPLGSGNSSATTSPNFEQERHFFLPNDLRDSTLSAGSGRHSLSPSLARASIGTTIYRSHAEVSPRPAQQALRGKAAVVTLSKSGNNSPSDNASPEAAAGSTVPHAQSGIINSPIVARNVTARPIEVKKSNSVRKPAIPTLANLQAAAMVSLRPRAAVKEEKVEDEAEPIVHDMSIMKPRHQSRTETIIEDTPAVQQSQFTHFSSSRSSSISDMRASAAAARTSLHRFSRAVSKSSMSGSIPGQQPPHHLHKKSGSLSSLIEEAMTRAARDPMHGGLGSISENHQHGHTHPTSQGGQGLGESDSGSGSGPFSDANELRDSPSRSS